MSPSISDLFAQKFNEIQSKLPIKMNGGPQQDSTDGTVADASFADTLNNALSDTGSVNPSNSGAIDKEGNNRSADLARATASRASSKAVIPADKAKLMELINTSVDAAAKKYNVDPNLVRAVIKQESGFDPKSLSHTGAQGLMQLMPDTADGLGVTDPWDVQQNIDGGTQYLRDQLVAFNGDIKLALASYNAGPGAVRKYNGVPPYAETQDYVKRVMSFYNDYSSGD